MQEACDSDAPLEQREDEVSCPEVTQALYPDQLERESMHMEQQHGTEHVTEGSNVEETFAPLEQQEDGVFCLETTQALYPNQVERESIPMEQQHGTEHVMEGSNVDETFATDTCSTDNPRITKVRTSTVAILDQPTTEDFLCKNDLKPERQSTEAVSVGEILNNPETEDWLSRNTQEPLPGSGKAPSKDGTKNVQAILNNPETEDWLNNITKKARPFGCGEMDERERAAPEPPQAPVVPVHEVMSESERDELGREEPEPQQTRVVPAGGRRPGAYSGAPGATLIRLDQPRYSRIGLEGQAAFDSNSAQRIEDLVVLPNSQSRTFESSSLGLVEANLIAEESGTDQSLIRARSVDLRASERKRAQRKVYERIGFLFLLVFVFVAVGITLGLVLPNKKFTDAADIDSVPTIIAPSQAPSNAPTGVLDVFKASLPNYTLESLLDLQSTQSQAYHWLSNHPNITNLPEWKRRQLFALACFYFAFNGPDWVYGINKDWLDVERDECFWFTSLHGHISLGDSNSFLQQNRGVSCDELGHFEHLVFFGSKQQDQNLVMERVKMPPEISLLTSLKTLRLVGHNDRNVSLTDKLPPQIYYLSKLEWLDFSLSGLLGTIPSELGLFTNLNLLFLHGNSLTGKIPSELGALTAMEFLFLGGNGLTGAIPTELGTMSFLREMDLSDSILNGTIPLEVGVLADQNNLVALNVSGSALSGTIPRELCDLRNTNSCIYGKDYDPLVFMGRDHDGVEATNRSCSLDFDCSKDHVCGCSCNCSMA